MIDIIYILGVIFVTFIIIILYIRSTISHNEELDKIKMLEHKRKLELDNLEIIRSRTQPCPYFTYNNPRSCYYDSKYRCSWNEQAKRCDKK